MIRPGGIRLRTSWNARRLCCRKDAVPSGFVGQLEHRIRRIEDADDQPILAVAETCGSAGDGNRLGAGVHRPYDIAGGARVDFVLDHHLTADEGGASSDRSGRPAIDGGQVIDDPFAAALDRAVKDRCPGARILIEPVDRKRVVARRAGPAERVLKWTRRHPSLAASLVSGILLLNGLVAMVVSVLVNRSVLTRMVEADFGLLQRKHLTVTGSTLRSRSVEEKAAIIAALGEKVWPLWSAGKLRVFTYRRFPLVEAAEAHRLMESSRHIGKILLVP